MFLKVIAGWERFSGSFLHAGLIACLAFPLMPLAAQNASHAVRGNPPGRGERDREATSNDLSGPSPASSVEVPAGVRLIADISYRDGNPAWRLDLAMPERPATAPRPGIVFVHGGGWRSGDKRQGYFLQGAMEYAQRGYVCIAVNYRLTGEAPFPACIEDVKCAVRWLRAHVGQYNVDPNRIGAYGNSAGAHLVALVGLAGPEAKLEGDGPYQDQSSRVQAVYCSATPTDFLNWGGPGQSFRGEGTLLAGPTETLEDRKRQASPISYVSASAPAFLIIHGIADRTVPFRQGQSFAEALKRSGARDVTFLEFEGAGHGVFMQHQDATHPAMEKFFARVLLQEPADSPDHQAVDAGANASQAAKRMTRGASSPRRDVRDRKAQRPRDREPSWLMPPVQGPNLHYETFDSKTAGQKVSYLIYLPPDYETAEPRRYPVVYWLHGIGGSQQGVPLMAERLTTAIEEGKTPAMIVVYVNGMIRSGWSDSEFPVETVAIAELIPHVDAVYRTVATREGRMVEGFSMGGSGAAKWGFKYPDLFGSISILDGALRSSDDADDPWKLAEKNAEQVKGRTTIRIVTRTTGLSGANEKLHDHLQRLGVPSEFHKIPDVPHAPNALYEGLGDKNWEFYRQAFARADRAQEKQPLAGSSLSADAKSRVLTIDMAPLEAMKSPWADYFGTHYARSPDEAGIVWSTVRSYGGTHVGFHVVENENAPPRQGPFTGTEIRLELSDFHAARGGPSAQQLIPDLMGHGMTAIYLTTTIVRPSTEPFDKDRAYWAVRLIHEAYPEAHRHIVWQIGNEVVSGHFDPKGVWTAMPPQDKRQDGMKEDNFFGYDLQWKERYYVNDYLAPAIEAIERVSTDLYGDPRKIRIALGSMNPYNQPNLAFLQNVMARRFDSEQAPTLQGDETWKHFDYLTVHYMTGSPQTIATLQQYHDDYLATGKVKGIWITEDHGRAGRGPVTILDRGLRFLQWAAKNHLSAEQTRLCWWGERERDPGGPGAEVAALIGQFFAGRQLYFCWQSVTAGTVYVLGEANDHRTQRVLIALVPDRGGSMYPRSLQINLPSAAMPRQWTVEAIQYSATKPSERFTPGCEIKKDGLQIALNCGIAEPALLMLTSGR